MSSALAIAGVSAALRSLLAQGLAAHQVAERLGAAPAVIIRPPDVGRSDLAATHPQLCLFLYRVAENTSLRNVEPPARGGEGRVRHNPPLALDLQYLLTSTGTTELQTEVLLGSALLTLRASPVLSSESVATALHDAFGEQDQTLHGSALRIALTNLRNDELTQLWSALQTPFRASVTFQVSALLMASADGAVDPASG
jgi:hypothetical protein